MIPENPYTANCKGCTEEITWDECSKVWAKWILEAFKDCPLSILGEENFIALEKLAIAGGS